MQVNKYFIRLYVSNKPGVLARVIQHFSRIGLNIDSLDVKADSDNIYSVINLSVMDCEQRIQRITKQLTKLIDVVDCNYNIDKK